MAVTFVTFPASTAAGALVSSACALTSVKGGFAVEVPSLSPAACLTLQFGQSATGPFSSLMKDDGTGAVYCAFSGTGQAFFTVGHPPTPYFRFAVQSNQTDQRTFVVLPVART